MSMKRRIAMALPAVIIAAALGGQPAYGGDSNPTVRVGLYYGANAMASANLANEVGSGYQFGYYDEGKNFLKLYETNREKLTVMKDDTMYLGSDGAYYDTLTSSSKATVGAYHVQLNQNFGDCQTAQKTAESLEVKGYPAFPSYVNGGAYVRVGKYETLNEAQSAVSKISAAAGVGATAVGASASCYTVTETKTDNILFEYDNGGALGILPISENAPSKTWFKGYQYYGGFSYLRAGGDITVINYVALDDYVKGVVPYEMSPNWHIEALKAQALCARGYAWANLNKHKALGFDVCCETDCQVYRGTNTANENSDRAAEETKGQFITYQGKAIEAVFCSSDGGSTENSENIWNNAVPYLRAVSDPYEDLDAIKNGRWSTTVTAEKVAAILKEKGYTVSGVSNLYIDKLTDAGNVYRLVVEDGTGKKLSFEKEQARTILNSATHGVTVLSQRYRINDGEVPSVQPPAPETGAQNGIYVNDKPASGSYTAIGADGQKQVNLDGKTVITAAGTEVIPAKETTRTTRGGNDNGAGSFKIHGTGWGHNVGMSQYGAKGMAEQGFTYDEIVKFYFTGVEISTIG